MAPVSRDDYSRLAVQREDGDWKSAGTISFRYEDICQDGRALLNPIPASLGSVWRHLIGPAPEGFRTEGILPILSRIRIELTEHRVSPFRAALVEGRTRKLEGTAKDHARVLLEVQARVSAPEGHALSEGNGGPTGIIGTMTGEHVLTRPFGTKEKRRVSPFDARACGFELEGSRPFVPANRIIEEPAGARAIDASFVRGDVHHAFGLMHTDANQHVNSLVYPRLFEEDVLRRLAALGMSHKVRARSLEIGYRRPSFAGDVVRVDTRLFERAGDVIAHGTFHSVSGDDSPRVYAELVLSA